jgi:hypothetical protein
VGEIVISQQDIESLGQKLEIITQGNERVLLAGILAIAVKVIRGEADDPPQVFHSTEPGSPAVVVQVEDPLPTIRAQIAAAFTPGTIVEVDELDVDDVGGGHLAAIRVGHVASVKVGPGS